MDRRRSAVVFPRRVLADGDAPCLGLVSSSIALRMLENQMGVLYYYFGQFVRQGTNAIAHAVMRSICEGSWYNFYDLSCEVFTRYLIDSNVNLDMLIFLQKLTDGQVIEHVLQIQM